MSSIFRHPQSTIDFPQSVVVLSQSAIDFPKSVVVHRPILIRRRTSTVLDYRLLHVVRRPNFFLFFSLSIHIASFRNVDPLYNRARSTSATKLSIFGKKDSFYSSLISKMRRTLTFGCMEKSFAAQCGNLAVSWCHYVYSFSSRSSKNGVEMVTSNKLLVK